LPLLYLLSLIQLAASVDEIKRLNNVLTGVQMIETGYE
jgi:hypothetical protein